MQEVFRIDGNETDESKMKMVDLIKHYFNQSILTGQERNILLLAVSIGINPFEDPRYLKIVVGGMKRAGFGKLYLSNPFLNRELFYRLYDAKAIYSIMVESPMIYMELISDTKPEFQSYKGKMVLDVNGMYVKIENILRIEIMSYETRKIIYERGGKQQ